MAAFDRDKWLERAQRRYRKALDAKRPHARKAYNTDKHFIDCLHVVVEWARQHGLTVLFNREVGGDSGGGKWIADERIIEVSPCSLPEYQFYTVLHEAGHYLLQGTGSPRKSYVERYGEGYTKAGNNHALEKKIEHRLAVLDEEFEAWHRGRKLADRLKLEIDEAKYTSVRNRMLKSYVGWVLTPNKYKD
jgi:hypothetical protein